MKYLDESPTVIGWGSEIVKVPYISPKDGRVHRYFVDFIVKVENRQGGTDVYLIEVKPFKQTKAPREPKRKTRRYFAECVTYAINTAKWEAAKKFAAERGWRFVIWTEKGNAKNEKAAFEITRLL